MTVERWLFVCFILPQVYAAVDQDFIDNFANNVGIKYTVLDNLAEVAVLSAEIAFTNNGPSVIDYDNWEIYLPNIYPFKLNGTLEENYKMELTHINGMLYKLVPLNGFPDIKSGDTYTVKVYIQFWSVARTDAMPNWYVTASGLRPKTIKNTADLDLKWVSDFSTKKQWKRYDFDLYNPLTPQERYDANEGEYSVVELGVIPTPKQISTDMTQTIHMRSTSWKIFSHAAASDEVDYLLEKLRALGYHVSVSSSNQTEDVIRLTLSSTPTATESYTLNVDPATSTIDIEGDDVDGVFYGIQSLLALIHNDRLPKVQITDGPRFPYRGLHLDVARNFHGIEDVKRLLDVMAMYKLNKFHFHLTDDEGWRIEIEGLPELTQVGSHRCHDMEELSCILPQLGSGPDTSTSGSGYFTINQYKDIVQYANERHIEVIPEVDMPGHGRAAIKAMDARYIRFTDIGDKDSAEQYLLSEQNDPSSYESVQFFNDNAINPCLNSTYHFVQKVITTLINYHDDIGVPLRIFHFGGDEVAHGAWENSTACKNMMADYSNINTTSGLRAYFAKSVANIAADLGLNVAAWEDGLMHYPSDNVFDRDFFPNTEVYGNAWNNVWEWGSADRAYKLANGGFKTIMSQATRLYFDHPYEADPDERGYYWATRNTSTREVFNFQPDDLYANIDFKRSGEAITYKDVCPAGCTQLNISENIIGMQGHIWSETIRTSSNLDYNLFPRVLALAERAWYKASWEDVTDVSNRTDMQDEDWNKFINILGFKDLARLDKMNVQYRIPPPGITYSKDSGKLFANNEIPGLQIEYSEAGSSVWKLIHESGIAVDPATQYTFRTLAPSGRRHSRVMTFTTPGDKEEPGTTTPADKGNTCGCSDLRSHSSLLPGTLTVVYIMLRLCYL